MGLTTLTALVLRGQSYTLAHVGDSRAYLLRGGEIQQLTHDHVVDHPDFKHQLLRAVGAEDHVVVDYLQGELQVGDVFVLVTDGVHGVLREQPPARTCRPAGKQSAQLASQKLVDAALAAGSQRQRHRPGGAGAGPAGRDLAGRQPHGAEPAGSAAPEGGRA